METVVFIFGIIVGLIIPEFLKEPLYTFPRKVNRLIYKSIMHDCKSEDDANVIEKLIQVYENEFPKYSIETKRNGAMLRDSLKNKMKEINKE